MRIFYDGNNKQGKTKRESIFFLHVLIVHNILGPDGILHWNLSFHCSIGFKRDSLLVVIS